MGKRKFSRFIRAWKVIKQGSKAVKSLANVAKKLGPLLAPVLNLIAQILTWGQKVLHFSLKIYGY